MLQLFAVPWCLRRFGVQGTNLFFPYVLLGAFGLIAASLGVPAVALPGAMFARFTRSSLMPTLRGTTRTLMLNAVPRKTGALVRSFNTAMVMPLGQGAGALLLVMLKGIALPWLFPVLGLLITLVFIIYSYKQNTAYGEALLDLLKEDRIHLLDLEDDDIRQFDSVAVTAISERLKSDQDDVTTSRDPRARVVNTGGTRIVICMRISSCRKGWLPAPAAGQRRRFVFQSFRICRAALKPGAPVTPPPGWVPAPHR
jgi:hypothetical protein